MSTLELIDLEKRFGPVTAVERLNLSVADGESGRRELSSLPFTVR